MDYKQIGDTLLQTINLLNLGGENIEKATLIITQVIALTRVADIAYSGFKELQEIAGREDMTQAELQKHFTETDKRMQAAINRLNKVS